MGLNGTQTIAVEFQGLIYTEYDNMLFQSLSHVQCRMLLGFIVNYT